MITWKVRVFLCFGLVKFLQSTASCPTESLNQLIDILFLDGRDCVEKSNLNTRIGGPDACGVIPHSKPWIAHGWRFRGLCGGTLIGSKYVLTAAHCVCKRMYDCETLMAEYAILGDHDRTVEDDGEIRINVSSVIVHPDFKSNLLIIRIRIRL